jgi:uncharacterized membrane protein YbhN (UPF0104 family)
LKQIIVEKLSFIFKYLIGIGLLAFIMIKFDPIKIFDHMTRISLPALAIFFGLTLLNISLQFARWFFLIDKHSKNYHKRDLIPSFFAGFAFRMMLPGGYAEISKVFLLPGKKSGKVVAFAVEKYFEAYIKFIAVIIALPFVFVEYQNSLWPLAFAAVIFYFFLPKVMRLTVLKRFKEKENHYGLIFFQVLLFILLILVVLTSLYYTLLNDLTTIPFSKTFFSTIFLWGAGLIPITISGMGVRESFSVYFLGLYAVEAPIAIAVSFIIFTFNMIIPALIGWIFIYQKQHHLKDAGGTIKQGAKSIYKKMKEKK